MDGQGSRQLCDIHYNILFHILHRMLHYSLPLSIFQLGHSQLKKSSQKSKIRITFLINTICTTITGTAPPLCPTITFLDSQIIYTCKTTFRKNFIAFLAI
jgi:hypothetical protein